MEFLEDESRPRFHVQSRSTTAAAAAAAADEDIEAHKPWKLHLLACVSSALLLLVSAILVLPPDSPTMSFLLCWCSLSLLLAPFAPRSITGGDPFVGQGPLLPPPSPPPPSPVSNPEPRRHHRRSEISSTIPVQNPIPDRVKEENPNSSRREEEVVEEKEEEEWTEEDLGILRKQISRHPPGEPRRWDRVAEAFGGRHGVELVISMSKSLSEKRHGDDDAYERFLKQRKPLDNRVEETTTAASKDGSSDSDKGWSAREDIALLNALKAFPKEATMRWEKVAAAVPGRSKAACVRRVAELKKSFRSSKGSSSET